MFCSLIRKETNAEERSCCRIKRRTRVYTVQRPTFQTRNDAAPPTHPAAEGKKGRLVSWRAEAEIRDETDPNAWARE